MLTLQEAVLRLEVRFAHLQHHVDTYQRLVGAVQEEGFEGLCEALNLLHSTSRAIKEEGETLHRVLELTKRGPQCPLYRTRTLGQKLELARRQFEQSQQTLMSYTKLINDGLN